MKNCSGRTIKNKIYRKNIMIVGDCGAVGHKKDHKLRCIKDVLEKIQVLEY